MSLIVDSKLVLGKLDLCEVECGVLSGGTKILDNYSPINSYSPIDGSLIGSVSSADRDAVDKVIESSNVAYLAWQSVPAPKRGELLRIFGNLLRENKEFLANLLTLEVGKIYQESLGEVQEMIDVCDMAVGQSRQLFGLTIASERPKHRLMEQWHPLGVVGIISAFNFPMAVWAWNAALAIICGNSVIWKPSEKAPFCAIACHKIFQQAIAKFGSAPENLCSLVLGGKEVGEQISESQAVKLISATGSVRMGKEVAVVVAKRLGRSLLELGGNNALIVTDTADIELAIRAITFAAVGTAGQRCTTLRRLIVHKSKYLDLVERLKKIFETIKIGSPWDKDTLVGPLIDESAAKSYENAIALAQSQGGKVHNFGRVSVVGSGAYVRPCLIEIDSGASIVREETFAPILYVMKYEDFEEAIRIQNDVPQGLSSAVFTNNIKEAEVFMSPFGSDCGIANVNIGTSGAEVGGAFGGEKESGGGRECGSDVWKNYMRRTSNTINYSSELPLAQGVKFL